MYIIVKIDSVEDAKNVQKVCFENNIGWYGSISRYYPDKNCYYVINTKDGLYERGIIIYVSPLEVDVRIIESIAKDHNIDMKINTYYDNIKKYGFIKIYNSSEINIIRSLIKYGYAPNYKPKRIIRKIE